MPNPIEGAHVRWMKPISDLPEVLAIECDCYDIPWSEEDFTEALKGATGIVVDTGDELLGFAIYILRDSEVHLLDIAVDSGYRRLGVGCMLLDWIKHRIKPPKRDKLVLEVRESNLSAQMFFRAMGLKAIKVNRQAYLDTREDSYVFSWSADTSTGNDSLVSNCSGGVA